MNVAAPWHERAREEAHLMNPAFLAQLVERMAAGYRGRSATGMPWMLGFLGLPIVLHKATRDSLPMTINTSMAAWTRSNPLAVESLAGRAQSLAPLVREALLFGLAHGVVRQDGSTLLPPTRRPRRPRGVLWRDPTIDFRACTSRSEFFGRWCADAGTPATIFALWGVRP